MLSIEIVRGVLFWCSIINFSLLAFWGLLMLTPHEWMHRFWSRWYRISAEQFDVIQLSGIVLYELLIFVFNLIPYIALLIIG